MRLSFVLVWCVVSAAWADINHYWENAVLLLQPCSARNCADDKRRSFAGQESRGFRRKSEIRCAVY
jgi:hypothetical protein